MEAAGPLAKNIGPERTEAIRQQLGLGVGDAAFFLGGKPAAFERVAGKARVVIGDELGLTDKDRFAFAWIVDFPMYEKDDETGRVLKEPPRIIETINDIFLVIKIDGDYIYLQGGHQEDPIRVRLPNEIMNLVRLNDNLDLVLALADRVFALENGAVFHEGSAQALLNDLDYRKEVLWL